MTNLEIIKFIKERKQLSSEDVAIQLREVWPAPEKLSDMLDMVNIVRECLPS